MKPRFLWITDPWDTLDHPKDTTLRLVEESLAMGFENYWCDVKTIRLENHQILLDACMVKGIYPGRAAASFSLGAPTPMKPSLFTRLLYRPDPPVDQAYLHPLQLLVLGVRDAKNAEIIAPSRVLFSANEKTEGALMADLTPPSAVSSQWETLLAFGRAEGKTILKPLHQAQSAGIALLDWTSEAEISKSKIILDASTEHFQKLVILQRFLPEIAQGEQRLWFLNGHLLAVARKKPKSGEVVINMDQGGTLVRTELTDHEKRQSVKIRKLLRLRKIRLAAVDLIAGKVTDFNFTSPGLLVQIEVLLGENLARTIMKSLAKSWR